MIMGYANGGLSPLLVFNTSITYWNENRVMKDYLSLIFLSHFFHSDNQLLKECELKGNSYS